LKLNKEFTLPKEFKGKVNLKTLAQAIFVYEERGHVGLRNTKTRSEVNRTKKKVYKQKGTGGARHGSRRANLFVGGGVIFGPRPERRILTLPEGIKNAAKLAAFSAKAKEKEVLALDGLSKLIKTKEAALFLREAKINKATFVLSEENRASAKFLRNLGNAKVVFYRDINAFNIVTGGTLIIDTQIFK